MVEASRYDVCVWRAQVYVEQPSVAQTVSILRGLRERYEVHHGVRISDSALVEAAVLSDRYIADRCGLRTAAGGPAGTCAPPRLVPHR